MRERSRRWAWLGVLIIGLILYVVVLRTLVHTQNPNLVPSLILLGATVVPLSFLTFAQARTGRWQVPASALQMHPHATVVVDEAAAQQLKLVDYYKATYASKPAWQGI